MLQDFNFSTISPSPSTNCNQLSYLYKQNGVTILGKGNAQTFNVSENNKQLYALLLLSLKLYAVEHTVDKKFYLKIIGAQRTCEN